MKKIADYNDQTEWSVYRDCRDLEHDPPTMIVLPPGLYEHACPTCGKRRRVLIRPGPRL